MVPIAIVVFVSLAYLAEIYAGALLLRHARDSWNAIVRGAYWRSIKAELALDAHRDVCGPGSKHPVFAETAIKPDAPLCTVRLLDGVSDGIVTQLGWVDIDLFARAREVAGLFEDPVTEEAHVVRVRWMVWVDDTGRHYADDKLSFEPEHWTEWEWTTND